MLHIMESLNDWASCEGYLFAWTNPLLLDLVAGEISARKGNGELDAAFCERWLEPRIGYTPHLDGGKLRSILMIAVPRPAHAVRFETRGGFVETIVPPVFIEDKAVPKRILSQLQSIASGGHRVEPMGGLHKGVAARAGLVRYGRNNITYTREFGSYLQIIPFVTDVELPDAALPLRPPGVLDECAGCGTCRRACPTGAIGEDRFLLRAERCLTYFNEEVYEWPAWLPDRAHHCLVGCMKCQECCPVNAGKLKVETLPDVFTLEETEAILGDFSLPDGRQVDARSGPVWESIRRKLASIRLPWLEDMIGRNMRALEKALGHHWS